VRGLHIFRENFAGHADQFVLIGGTAATLAMEEAGLEFRATKDRKWMAARCSCHDSYFLKQLSANGRNAQFH
jgi:hypothetical protein